MTMNAAKQRFDQNEKRLEQLARDGKYVYDDHRWPELMPLAARLEAEQDRLLELI